MAGEHGVNTIDPEVRGILLACAAMGGAPSGLVALGDERREACARAWQGLQRLDEAARGRALAAWRAEAASAVPAGLGALHPSWMEEAVADETPEVVAAVQATLVAPTGMPEPVARELRRLAAAPLVPLTVGAIGPLARSLSELDFDELLTEVTRRGARAVGRSLAGAVPALLARAMAVAGEPWAEAIAAGAREGVDHAGRSKAAAWAAVAVQGLTSVERLQRVGLEVLREELAVEGLASLGRVAGRLPAALGRTLLGW